MGSPIGFHYAPNHRHEYYLQAFTDAQPNVILILDGSRDDYNEVRRRSPNSKIIMRSYDWSDGGMSVLHRAQTDPVGTGNWMADQWINRVREWGNTIDRNITYFTGVNEYTVIPGVPIPPLVTCENAFALRLATQGLKGCIGNEGVGHPSMINSQGMVDWSLYTIWEQTLQKTGGILGLHSYWLAQYGPRMNVKPEDEARNRFWYAWRFMQCPFDVPIVISEHGVDQKIDAPMGTPSQGWQGLLSPQEYTAQLYEYCVKAVTDKRFVGTTIFTHDYNSTEWATYDTARGLSEIVAMARNLPSIGWYVPGYNPTPIPPEPVPPQPPIHGKIVHPLPAGTFTITQRFNETDTNPKGHEGMDFGCAEGTPVYSIAAGKVMYVGVDKDYGNYVRVWHPQLKMHSFYAHLAGYGVEIGRILRAGDLIAASGNSGNSTGPHLHLETRLGTETVYSTVTHKANGRVDPETMCAFYGLSLSTGQIVGVADDVFLPLILG